jgi:DNA-binding transcriptional regulator GbsR (MarR family)
MSLPTLITRLLQAQPMTTIELTEKLNMKRNTVSVTMGRLRKAHKVYVAGWTPLPGTRRPIYHAGDQPDVPQPSAQSARQRNLRRRQKRKADLDHCLNLRLAERARRQAASSTTRTDPLTAALFDKAS